MLVELGSMALWYHAAKLDKTALMIVLQVTQVARSSATSYLISVFAVVDSSVKGTSETRQHERAAVKS